MADLHDNILIRGARGTIDGVMLKQFEGKTIAGKSPDMSGVVPSKQQLKYRGSFSEAVKYATDINNDPQKRGQYQERMKKETGGQKKSVFHYALQKFMLEHSEKVPDRVVQKTIDQLRKRFPLSDRQAHGLEYLVAQKTLTNRIYRRLNKVSKPTATRDLQALVALGIIEAPQSTGAGAKYRLIATACEKESAQKP